MKLRSGECYYWHDGPLLQELLTRDGAGRFLAVRDTDDEFLVVPLREDPKLPLQGPALRRAFQGFDHHWVWNEQTGRARRVNGPIPNDQLPGQER